MAQEGLPVQIATNVLNASASGYYDWRTRAPSARAIRHVILTDTIRQVHTASRGTYGARRVHAELTLARRLQVSRGTVELLMARAGLKGVTGRPRWRRPRPDLISSDSSTDASPRNGLDELWAPTSPSTREGKVYCAGALDVCSRRVVGW
jgi:putative transposase